LAAGKPAYSGGRAGVPSARQGLLEARGMRVGFIGLGHMGSPMAANLVKAGHDVVVYNRTPGKERPLVEAGARVARTVADAAAADAVITMVADDAALEAVVAGEHGLLAHLRRGAIHVSSTTISVALSGRLSAAHAAAGQRFVAAPVFGRPDAAAAARLFIVTAGPADAVGECAPLFDAVGQRTFVAGDEPPMANLIKLSGNFLIASVIEALGEAMTLIRKGGVDPDRYLEILTSTLFGAPIYRTYGTLVVGQQFEPAGFAAPLGAKDIRLTLEAAETLRAPLPLASLLRDRFLALLAQGGERLDWSAISRLALQDAGLDAPAKA
jgi:3-hydroxyisobutyrate dehydrogenase-like beta-hydroxyacid dehydrogenase